MKITVEIVSNPYTIREVDSTDSWDIGEDGLHIHGVAVGKTDKDYDWDVPDDATNLVVLVEHYSDGCTFGSSEYADVKGVFTHQADAEKFAAAQKIDHGYFGSHIGWRYFEVTL